MKKSEPEKDSSGQRQRANTDPGKRHTWQETAQMTGWAAFHLGSMVNSEV